MTAKKNKNKYKLTKKEQKTTVAFKMLSGENDLLKKSLKKTQDELEKMRQKKFEHEKENNLLKYKLEYVFWIEMFKFFSSAGIGVAGNYLLNKEVNIALSIGIPSVIIFIVSLLFSNKKRDKK